MGKKIVFCAGAVHPHLSILSSLSYDMLVGVDGGAKRLVEAGYTLDWAIGDFDSVNPPNSKQSVILPCEKDDTDLQYALHYILNATVREPVEQVYILGALGGGRLDHLICNLWLVYQDRFAKWIDKLMFIEKENTITFFHPGTYTLHKENNKKYLSFIGMTPLQALSLQEVKYTLDRANYHTPVSLISNEFLHTKMTFSFEEGLMCVIQSCDKMMGN